MQLEIDILFIMTFLHLLEIKTRNSNINNIKSYYHEMNKTLGHKALHGNLSNQIYFALEQYNSNNF